MGALVMYLVIAFWLGPFWFAPMCGSNIRTAEMEMGQIEQMVETYYMTEDELPGSLEELTEGEPPITEVEVMPDDPWGTPYLYEIEDAENGEFVVYSAGPDEEPGTEKDVHVDE